MDNLIFVATKDGLIAAQRGDDDWRAADHNLASQNVTCVSVQEGKVLAGTTNGIFHSEDLGRTWRPADVGLSVSHIRWIQYHPDVGGRAFAGTEPAAIFVTDDDAKTWRECPEVARLRDENDWYLPYSPEAGCVRGFAFEGDRGYAAVEQGGVLRSDDTGETWQPVEGCEPNPRAERPETFVHPDVHSIVALSSGAVLAPTGGGLYLSGDGGKFWMQLYDCYCRAVWVNPNDEAHLIFGPADSVDTNGRIAESRDGGQTWAAISTGLELPWPDHMVERFVQVENELLAVLSNGHLLAAPLAPLLWRRILPEIDTVNAVAVASL